MKLNKLLICFLLLIFITSAMEGAPVRIYVSSSGNDQNPGSQERPVASLAAARDLIRNMRQQRALTDTVYVEVMPGEYFMDQALQLTPADAGTKQSPVVFRGQSNARTVFYGGLETGRFEVINPNLWRVFIPEVAKYKLYFEQLYINGERRFRAQTPNRGELYEVRQMKETILLPSEGRTPAYTSQKVSLYEDGLKILRDLQPNELDDALAVFYHSWDNTRKRISYFNLRDSSLCLVGRNAQPWNAINQNTRYAVENYREALDAPGEWFLQRDGYLYYIPMQGETPEKIQCIFPVNEKFMVIEGDENKKVENIRFENLSFHVAAYNTPPRGNDPYQAAAIVEASIMLDNTQNIDFIGCEIAHTGLHGMWFRHNCSNSNIERCHLYDLGGGGIKIGGIAWRGTDAELSRLTHHIRVHNNIIQHGGFVFPCAVGVIIFHGSDNELTHNDIANFRYSGISAGWVWGYGNSPSQRNKIEFNHIHHLGWGELSDMGGVYTLGNSKGTTVSNNVIHHIYSWSYGGWGLYTDEGTRDILMENNLVYACKNAGFHQHYGRENIIRNNIFAFIIKSAIEVSKVEEHLSYTFTNNIIYQEKGDLIADVWGGDNGIKFKINIDMNSYWKTDNPSPKFYKLSFEEWKKLGRDKNSIIANPQFVDPENFDFRFKNTSVARKIKFKPFDYSKAGVYGSKEWIEKAKLSDQLIRQFDETVEKYERKNVKK